MGFVVAGQRVSLRAPKLDQGPDWFSFWSHALGGSGAIVGTCLMLSKTTTASGTIACAIYGVSMIFLFCCSSLHHAVQRPASYEVQDLFRRLDHISIYFFIAGSYTPICTLAVVGPGGKAMLALVWVMCAAGIAQKTLLPFSSRVATITTYVIMGWVSVGMIQPLQQMFPYHQLQFLVNGGMLYTVGACVYALKWPNPFPELVGFHGLWHIFVLLAATSHFVFNYYFVLALPTNAGVIFS